MLIRSISPKLDIRQLSSWATSQARAAWHFRLPILSGLFLVSPVLAFNVGVSVLNGRGVDRIILFALPASVLWLMLVYGLARKVWVAHLVLFPFYVLTIADLYLISSYGVRLNSSTISVLLQSSESAADFARTLSLFVIVAIPALIVSFGLLTFAMRQLRIQSWECLTIAVTGLPLIYVLAAYKDGILDYNWNGSVSDRVSDLLAHDQNSPFGIFSQGFVAYQIYERSLEGQRQAASFRFGATRPTEPKESEVYVLVVGESSQRDHWSLFGYSKPTTPRLARTPNVIPLENMVTQEAMTEVSVPLIITRGSIDHPRATLNEKSIISAFKEVGFRTFWLSTQQVDHWTAPIRRYSSEADHVAFFERRFDMVLVDTLRDILNKDVHQSGKQKLFFVLHTIGSHWLYRARYPEAGAPFKPVGTEREKTIAEYDNSIEYTDNVLSQLISTLSKYRGEAALLYVSDHGENVYDDSKMLLGHFFENQYDIPIPAFLWTSQSYANQHSGLVEAAKRNAVRPLNTRVVFSTLAQMAGIEIPGMDIGRLSVLSDHLQLGPRLFYKQGTIMDYDRWAGSSGLHRQVKHQHAGE